MNSGPTSAPRLAAGAVLLVALSHAAAAQTAAVAPGVSASSAGTVEPRYGTLSLDSPFGEIIDSPAGLALLRKEVPEILTARSEQKSVRKLSLRAMSVYLPSLTPEKLARLDAALRRIAAPPPDLGGPAGDPPFVQQKLTLSKAPKGRGRPVALFNGRNLDGWDVYLGPPERTGKANLPVGTPIGLNNDPERIFSVQMADGAPAIRADGKIWGTLTTKRDFRNYWLHVEYKWGQKWSQDLSFPRNNGILYHSYGDFGALDKTWMNSIELEIVPGKVGGANPVGSDSWFTTTVGRDAKLDTPTKRRFMLGGREISVGEDGFEFIQGSTEAENPLGRWNTIDLYVFGDRAIHVLNGVPVMAVSNMTGGGDHAPLTHGRIQLQSEGAETFFRNLTIKEIDRLPVISASRP